MPTRISSWEEKGKTSDVGEPVKGRKTSINANGAGGRSSRKKTLPKHPLGNHPLPSHLFGKVFLSQDGETINKIPFRALVAQESERNAMVGGIQDMLVKHHVSPQALERSKQQQAAIQELGLELGDVLPRRFPLNPSTRKGNLAEIVLAEYLVASSDVSLPVYRLRYNPNIDQSMKGDDVLAFDLDADPVRIVVGEAKFRGVSSVTVVKEIVDSLLRSHKAGIPASLQFVADRLFEEGQHDLGKRVFECAILFARDRLQLDYVGLLVSDTQSVTRVVGSTPNSLKRLAMISLSLADPDSLVDACYQGLQ